MADAFLQRFFDLFGDAGVAAIVSFCVARFLPTRPGNVAREFVRAISDGKITAREIAILREALRSGLPEV
jgi:hypothetical protein